MYMPYVHKSNYQSGNFCLNKLMLYHLKTSTEDTKGIIFISSYKHTMVSQGHYVNKESSLVFRWKPIYIRMSKQYKFLHIHNCNLLPRIMKLKTPCGLLKQFTKRLLSLLYEDPSYLLACITMLEHKVNFIVDWEMFVIKL